MNFDDESRMGFETSKEKNEPSSTSTRSKRRYH